MTQNQAKAKAARAALKYLVPDSVLGVGTGSTVNLLIDALADQRHQIKAAVSSSEASTARLKAVGIPVVDLDGAGRLSVYIDGADEANPALELIKGGGGALTREKIVAAASDQFVCIADESKFVQQLGAFPLPIEVIAMARQMIGGKLESMGAQARWRQGFVTDNGHQILDVSGLNLSDPRATERELSLIPGVVTVGLFAQRPADVLILGSAHGVREISANQT